MKKLYNIKVKGNNKTWSFNFLGYPDCKQDWIDDGLEIMELCNTIPQWVVDLKLTKIWCWLQDHWLIPLDE